MKKYFIRTVGALCILASIALLFLTTSVKIDGIKRATMKEISKDAVEILETVSDQTQTNVKNDEDFKDELKDCGFPATSGGIKKYFRNLTTLTKEALNAEVSLTELLKISVKAPGIIKDANGFYSVDSDAIADSVTQQTIEKMKEEDPDARFSEESIRNFKDGLNKTVETVLETLSTYSFAFILLAGLMILHVLLAAASAVTNICNKVRWLKYLALVPVALYVLIGAVGLPIVNNLLFNQIELAEPFENLKLKMTLMPYLSLVLMLVPVVLDIAFERKLQNQIPETTAARDYNYAPAAEYDETSTSVEVVEEIVEEATVVDETVCVNKVQPQNDQDTQPQNDQYTQPTPKKKRRWKFWLFGGIITAAVAAVAVVVLLLASNTYKTPVRLLEKMANTKKASKMIDKYVDSLNGFCEDDCKEALKILKNTDYYEDMLEAFEYTIDMSTDEYGDNYKIKYKVADKEKVDSDDRKEFQANMRDEGAELLEELEYIDYEELAYDLDISESQAKKLIKTMENIAKTYKKAKVSEAYVLTLSRKITGSELDEPEEDEYEMCVYKVNGRWVEANMLHLSLSLCFGVLNT